MELLGVVGSLRVGSYNAQLMDATGLPVFAGLRDIPPFDEDRDAREAPTAVIAFREAIAAADGVLFATPEYNGSIPGVLKNALDWASVPFEENVLRNKPVAVVGTSTGMFGAVWAQAELRKVLGLIGARVLDRDTPVGLASGAPTLEAREAVLATVRDLEHLVEARAAV